MGSSWYKSTFIFILIKPKIIRRHKQKSPFQCMITTTYQNPEENVLQLVTISTSAKKI